MTPNPAQRRQGIWSDFLLLIPVLLLTACGGHCNFDCRYVNAAHDAALPAAPAAPSLSLTPQSIKTFAFSWGDVAGETEYRLLEDPDGVSGYTRIATLPANATTHDQQVFLPIRVNARYVLQACNTGGCTDSSPVPMSGALTGAIGYAKASNTGAYVGFGTAVAVAGDTLVVGAPWEQSSAANSGAVYVFVRSGTTWTQQAYLKASNTGADDKFGTAVALTSDTLVVGAPQEDSGATGIDGDQADNSVVDSGAAYVFVRTGTTWTQQAYLKASNTGADDRFGITVAIVGDNLVVGAPQEDSGATGIDGNQADNSASNSGAAYVFVRSGTTWTQQAYLKASNSGADDYFGWSVTLAGDTLVVGAPQEDSGATESGAAYVFLRSGTTWTQQAHLKAAVVGAYENFGWSVTLAGDTLAVGAPWEDSGGDDSGAAYVFVRSGTTWTQQAYLKASNAGAFDDFGWSVVLSGETLVVGAPWEDSNATGINSNQADESAADSGAAYVFVRSGTTWTQQAYLKAANTRMEDNFGWSVALAGDTLVIGAPWEDSNATGVGGDQADGSAPNGGAAYLY